MERVLECPGRKDVKSPGKSWNLVFAGPGKSWKKHFNETCRLCVCVQSDTPTPSLAVESSDSASGPSPRVMSARKRKYSHGCSEGNTPKTPKSALSASGKVADDRVFFGSNFSVEHLGDLPSMPRPTLGQFSVQPLTVDFSVSKSHAGGGVAAW